MTYDRIKIGARAILLAAVLAASPQPARAETAEVTVNGLVCAFCAAAIEKTFRAMPEIQSVLVDLDAKLVTLTFKSGMSLTDDNIRKTIEESGYSIVDTKRRP